MTEFDYEIVVFFALIIAAALYVMVVNNSRRKKSILRKLENGFGAVPKNKYTAEEYENISHYFKRHMNENSIDDITWNDLDMDNVFKMINNTNSSIGQEYLYRMLRQPDTDVETLKEVHRLAEEFSQNKDARIEVQKIFVHIGRAKRISISDYVDVVVDLKKQSNILHYMTIAMLAAAILFTVFVNPALGIWACIASLSFSIITYYRYKAKVEKYFICINYVVKMLLASQKLQKLDIDFIRTYTDRLRSVNKELSAVTKGSWLLESGNVDGSIVEMLLEYLRMLTHMDLIKFNNMAHMLGNKSSEVYKLIDILGFIEASIAVASFRKLIGKWCMPVFKEGLSTDFEVEQVFHPLIDHPIANSIKVRKNVLLTGSNASGKSTFLKTIAINSLLSQTIYTSVSDKYIAPRFRIYSSMALRDDLGSSSSYYIVEIKSLKRILDAIGQKGLPVLCFIDEVLRGTNTVERIAASSEILKSISKKRAVCFAATHDIELTTMLEGYYENFHFQEEVTENNVIFNFKLFRGAATTRNAIKLLNTIGYDREIICAAEQQAAYFMSNGTWKE